MNNNTAILAADIGWVLLAAFSVLWVVSGWPMTASLSLLSWLVGIAVAITLASPLILLGRLITDWRKQQLW